MRQLIRILFIVVLATQVLDIFASNLSLSYTTKNKDSLNASIASGTTSLYGMARTWTPVFYREDFPQYFGGATGDTLILDDWAQIDPTETIVFPKSVFQIQKIVQVGVQTLLQVTTREYPYSDTHYIDARFVKIIETKTPPQERTIKLPNRIGIVRKMKSQVGKPYVW